MIWIFSAGFFLILMILILINYKVNKEFKIETSWLALSLAPVVIWLMTTEQLSEFSGFGLAFKLKEATAKPVSLKLDGDMISPEQITADEKEGLSKIDSFIQRKVAAVTLKIDKPRYYNNWAISQYLERLTPYSFFKYVLFVKESGTFVGIIDASDLYDQMRNNSVNLVARLEAGKIDDIAGVNTISILSGSSKEDSLQMMDKLGLAELPVVDEQGHFKGIVERDKITSSIVAQLVSSARK